jgi:hypothetical protein
MKLPDQSEALKTTYEINIKINYDVTVKWNIDELYLDRIRFRTETDW